ncbi:MAG: hypothetical protein IT183_10120 [Acidobacteria bacterium]|nr:hypothetical protein [Acidobacteriota bacterium]
MPLRLPGCLTLALVLTAIVRYPATAAAQAPASDGVRPITGLAVTTQYDDETHLGRGAQVSGGASMLAGSRVRIEGEAALGRHWRGGPSAGQLEATGTAFTGTARAALLFGSASSQVRPFVSGGLLVLHSRGEFRSTSFVPGPDGRPIEGPETRTAWRLTKPGWEAGAGFEVGRAGRPIWRPEVRLVVTQGNDEYEPGADTLEAPLLALRGGLTVIW